LGPSATLRRITTVEMIVKREPRIGIALPGEMFVDNTHVCFTLENADDAIPPGRYKVTMYDSPKFGEKMPLLNDVPGREYIEIHWGSFPRNFEGCIGVGELQDGMTGDIFNTRKMWQSLVLPIEAAVAQEGCFITIS